MKDRIFADIIYKALGINIEQVLSTISLLNNDHTVPFISRYRKEATGGLDEVQIQNISIKYNSLKDLDKRKETILKTIESLQKLTPELKERIDNCWDEVTLEDIYLPYKPKRRTKAEIARNKGLEPLAKIIMAQNDDDISYRARKFLNEDVTTVDEAISGALDIIADWISENERVRNKIRSFFRYSSQITSKIIKGKEVEGEKYENYFNTCDKLSRCSSHRLLAMRRAEKEGILRISIDIDEDEAIDSINNVVIKNKNANNELLKIATKDSYKRLIKPTIETEFAKASKEKADAEAISLFAQNLRQLLFAPPLANKRVMGIDPGFRTGCKIVCLDEQGNLLHNDTIYPNPPQNDFQLSAKKISNLIESYKIDTISLGNGTACRETEKFLSSIQFPRKVQVFITSENGASIYSASKLAREEFPDKDVTVRGAVSIGRRLIDPLSELIKIDPKSIGVGQYQYDVDQNKLKESLDFTVESCVNQVGVNVNTASKELLSYISGLGPQLAKNIVAFRTENGDFKQRLDLLKVPRMGSKAFEQSAGFLRISNGPNPLDNTAVHPERYKIVEDMAKKCHCNIEDLIKDKSSRASIDLNNFTSSDVGLPTLTDIMSELDKPGRDPRTEVKVLQFDDKIKSINDLSIGMVLNGIITNITQFGVFVDFGIKENGLVHISEICNKFISSPTEAVSLHQHVKVKVIDVDMHRKRIALTMKDI